MLLGRFPPILSGAGLQALTLSKALRAVGVGVFVVTARRDNSPRMEKIQGLPVHRIGTIRRSRLSVYRWSLAVLPTLFRKRREYDVLHIHGVNIWGMPAALLARWCGKRVVIKVTGYAQDDPLHLQKEKFGKYKCRLFRWADATISISSLISNSYRVAGFPESKLNSIPNTVDIERFAPLLESDEKNRLRLRLGLEREKVVVINTGIVRWAKGIDILLAAWEIVQVDLPDALLMLVGNCDEEPEFVDWLKAELKEKKLERNVVLTGHVDNVEEYLQAADIYVFPSRREGLPNALLEAMASGLPCIALDIPNIIEDVITHGKDGVVVYDREPASLAREILQMVIDRSRRNSLGVLARKKTVDFFSTPVVVQQYRDLYQRLSLQKRAKDL